MTIEKSFKLYESHNWHWTSLWVFDISNIVIVRKKPAEWQGVFIAEVNFTNIFEQLFVQKVLRISFMYLKFMIILFYGAR